MKLRSFHSFAQGQMSCALRKYNNSQISERETFQKNVLKQGKQVRELGIE
jgi:hypothetical protein